MCRVTMEHTRRCRIPSVQLYRRLGIAAVEQYYRRRLLRWAGHVSRMPMDRLPRQLPTVSVANPRPTGSPLITWGRTLKKAVIMCGQSPSFAVWRQAAADRMSWRQMCGQFAPLPRPKPASYADQVYEIIDSPPPRLGTPAAQPTTPAPPHQLRPQRCLRPQPRPSDGPRTAPCVDPVLKERPTTPSSRRRATAVGEAGARIAVLGSGDLDPGVYPTARPCISASLQRTVGLSRGLQLHGVPPLQWPEQWG